MTNLKNTKRVSFDVNLELYERFENCIRWGNRADLLRRVLELLVDKLELGGYTMIGAIMAGEFDPLFERKEPKNDT